MSLLLENSLRDEGFGCDSLTEDLLHAMIMTEETQTNV